MTAEGAAMVPCYIIVSPVRNEAARLPLTIASVTSQTMRPACWVLVDDGSDDDTAQIIADASARYPWVTGLRLHDRGFRQPGTGVIHAFEQGYAAVAAQYAWQYLVKLDGDLSFAPTYFETLFARMEANARFGICGGGIYNRIAGVWTYEANPLFHVRGATKVYRRECWDAIGGLLRAPGWDTLDEVKANMCGWQTRTFPELLVQHHKTTGSADGTWKNLYKNGRANYICGYHPLFVLLKSIKRIGRRPFVLGAAALLWGYVSSAVRPDIKQVDDPALITYMRVQQLRKVCGFSTIWQ